MKEKILIVDGMNVFIKAYIMNPQIDSRGDPIGGTFGFFKSLQKFVKDIQPSHVIVCWDGAMGSARRKSIAKGYKDGRKPLRLNRGYQPEMSNVEELENKRKQLVRTMQYLNSMPVIQVLINNIEADDLIAYICQSEMYKGKVKVIVSNDKDFYQLCNEETIIYRPTQDEFLNAKRIVEKHSIHPNNFTIARAMDGDRSDNLEGVPRCGIKTVAKRFPFLAAEKNVTIDDVINACKTSDSKLKIFKSILENEDLIKRNYQLMQLYSPSISPTSSQEVDYIIKNFIPRFNHTEIVKQFHLDGMDEYNWEYLFQKFRLFVAENKH